MRKFNLVLLSERKKIGTVEVDDDLKQIEIKLLERYRTQYQNVFSRLVGAVKDRGGFEVDQKEKALVFWTNSRDFWSALVQALITHLDILSVETDS